jgi:AraC-like DNA-binding protein
MHTFVRCASLNGYVEQARSVGLQPGPMMRRVGLDPADLATPEKWISAPAVARLLANSARDAQAPDFALKLAERRRLSTLGPLSLVLREEPDLRGALALLIRYEHSYNEALRMRLTEADELATVRLWLEFGEPAPVDQGLALGLAALHGIFRACMGSDWRPIAVCLGQRAPENRDTFHRLFGPGVRFEHEFTGLVFYSRDLDRRNTLADPMMRPYAQQFLTSVVSPRAATWSGRVRDMVEFLLPLGKCSIDQVARTLGVDRRTLQRHLAAEDTSFSEILHATRAGLAEHHLSNNRFSMTEVSEVLGFAAPSAFSRWFNQRFGVSPTEWRQSSAATSLTAGV